jgi:hypothetical protein
MRNVAPVRGDGPSSVRAVSVHEATNIVGANLTQLLAGIEAGVAALCTPGQGYEFFMNQIESQLGRGNET